MKVVWNGVFQGLNYNDGDINTNTINSNLNNRNKTRGEEVNFLYAFVTARMLETLFSFLSIE